MPDEFKDRIIQFAKDIQAVVKHATSEAATRQYLVLPFLQLLGYNSMDPGEVRPEVEASFADKFRNKVDYAIFKDGVPVIAIETKSAGTVHEIQRGEIRGYFNAVPSVKLGILTDGLLYELFTDTGEQNMMDERPFVRFTLTDVADGNLDDAALDAIMGLRKAVFDPAGVGADAKRKLYVAGYKTALDSLIKAPTEAFIRVLMDTACVEGKRTAKLLQDQAPIVADGIQHFLDKVILDRVGFGTRDDIVRKETPAPLGVTVAQPDYAAEEAPPCTGGIVTTEGELAVYQYAIRRLAFLIQEPDLFLKLNEVRWLDYKTVFSVFYKQERKGKMFNYREGVSPRHLFDFATTGASVQSNNLEDIDAELLNAFTQRVGELL